MSGANGTRVLIRDTAAVPPASRKPPDMVGCSAIQAVSHMATHKTWCGGGGGYLRVVAAYLARRGRRQESPGDETLHDAERTQQHGGVGGWSAPRKATAAFQTGSRPCL